MTTGPTEEQCGTPEGGPGGMPLALRLSEGLGAVSEARCCPKCDDGTGRSAFPYYGVAPHIHADTGRETPFDPLALIGSARTLPRDQWPAHFKPDPDCDGLGTYLHCPACGAPNVEAKAQTRQRMSP